MSSLSEEKENVEMKKLQVKNPLQGQQEMESSLSSETQTQWQYKKEVLGQEDVPTYLKTHLIDPWFRKCDKKIVKYDLRGLSIWRALLTASHTILGDRMTWIHILGLSIMCFVTFLIVWATNGQKSIGDSDQVVSKIQLLISFVLAGYITLIINRWDRIRNTYIATLWNSFEDLYLIAVRIFAKAQKNRMGNNKDTTGFGDEEEHILDLLIRYSQLCMLLTFMSLQKREDLTILMGSDYNVLTEAERRWIEPAPLGVRPLLVTSWISEVFYDIKKMGYEISASHEAMIGMYVNNIRGGMGGAFAAIGSQLPYPYVHLVYWTVQVLLAAVFIQLGCELAVATYTKQNGNDQYSPPDDDSFTDTWPQYEDVWYLNFFLQSFCGDIIFALFVKGILNICDKLNNPMSLDDTSFSERVYVTVMKNNCRALRAGFISYQSLKITGLISPLQQKLKRSEDRRDRDEASAFCIE